MIDWDRNLNIVEVALIASIERTLAMCDDEVRTNVLASLLLFHLRNLAESVVWESEGWRIFVVGPAQPAGVEGHFQAIRQIWDWAQHDNFGETG